MSCLFCSQAQFDFYHSTVWVKTAVSHNMQNITPVMLNYLTTSLEQIFW